MPRPRTEFRPLWASKPLSARTSKALKVRIRELLNEGLKGRLEVRGQERRSEGDAKEGGETRAVAVSVNVD